MLAALLTTLVMAATQAANVEEIRYDNRGRPVIQTFVNQQGPYYMVVDTAAQSSLMSPRLGDKLNINPIATDIVINGATGKTQAEIYPVK